MIRFGLECLLIFISIFGLNAAENGVHRVSRQDFNTPAFGAPASYQQPFESKNGIYRVQRQDFTNTNDVPFSDSYQSSYANRFSKLNYDSGNVNRSFTPLPKLFLPAVQRVENPYLSIGLPNYDRVVPASNFGKEFQTRASAPTRVTLRPQITIYEEKRPDNGALPAIPSSQDDSPLPSISEYSKSSPFDEDFSSVVEQFELSEDRKSICKGVDCRRSTNDDDAVRPIRKRRSLDYDPYHSSIGRNPWQNQLFGPFHYRNSYHPPFSSNPIYDHENDRVYSYLNSLSRNRPIYESSDSNGEELETPSTSFAHSEESTSTDNDVKFIPGINFGSVEEYPENSDNLVSWSWTHETNSEPESTTTSDPEPSDFFNLQDLELPSAPSDDNYDPLLSIDFEALIRNVENGREPETTPSYDFNHDDSLYSTETPLESANSDQDEAVTPIECFFQPESTESQIDSESTPRMAVSEDNSDESFYFIESTTNSDGNSDPTSEPTESTTANLGGNSDLTETPLEFANSDQHEDVTPIECLFHPETTESETDSDSTTRMPISEDNSDESFYFIESTTNSEDNSDPTSDPIESTTNSEDNSDPTSDPTESTTNSEAITDIESEPKFDVEDKPLTVDQKFVILFFCSMWPELYQNYPELDSNDTETRELNQLCHFLNSINDHIVVEVPSEPKPGCDEDESEPTTEKPKFNANEVFRNYFLQIIEKKIYRPSEPKPAEFIDHGEDADSASSLSANIPIVLTLRDNISK